MTTVSINKCLETLQRRSIERERESLNSSVLSLNKNKVLDPTKISFVKTGKLMNNATIEKFRITPQKQQRAESEYQMSNSVRRKSALLIKKRQDDP